MSHTWQVVPFDPETASPERWRMYHAFRRARWEERGYADEPFRPDEAEEASRREEWREDSEAHYAALIVEGDRIVAEFGGGAPMPGSDNYANNGHLLWAHAAVLRPWRRRGIGRLWLRHALECMPKTGATTLTTMTDEPDGHAFLKPLAGEPKQLLRYSRVAFQDLDWAMIDAWIAEQAERAPDTRLEVFPRRLPEALWPEYCAAKTEQMRHIPRDGLDMGDWTFTPQNQADMYKWMDAQDADHHVIWVRDADGRIVALTDVAYFPYAPELIQQFFTGVDMGARGRGLGKLVKARMLRFVGDTYGYDQLRWVRTDNATTNAAMLAINVRLGFREYKVSGIYQATQAQIEAYLGQAR